ncbi:MAG: Ktr system potassium uptake protein A [Chroococcopsis gigantea SAG 12.99]|jgi:trk system potassium uptake protein TrkA|nr:TrkA family potassium uptake protein [Chlorogloea purpurea SAG 13.99]MDV3000398.1 Ktr system potassium uptake protein A [Chroococcopsis gigantea SAG 12.99]
MQNFKFLNNIRSNNRQFAVIGLGRFGRAVCEVLYKQGYQVLGTDIDESLVALALSERILGNAIQLDSTKPSALKEAGIFEIDTVIVAIGKYVEVSVVTTLNIKEAGVNYIAAKASTEIHGKLLKKVGADLVVFPEYDAGCELAHRLTKPSILERLDLDPEHSIVELTVPEVFHNKTLAELEIRNKYGLNIVAVGSPAQFKINPDPQERLYKGLAMVVIGSNKDIQRLPM